jgi:hypothetical protein
LSNAAATIPGPLALMSMNWYFCAIAFLLLIAADAN